MLKLFYLIFLLPVVAQAQLQLAKLFSDNMVIQRDKPIPVWGKAPPGKMITVSLSKKIKSTKAKADSSWSVNMPPQMANTEPQRMKVISGNDTVVIANILIGDIWVCIGQSNMEWPVFREIHFIDELRSSNQSLLRFYNPLYAGKNIYNAAFSDSVIQLLTAEKFYRGSWQPCDSNTFKTMSAVAYYFGKVVMQKIGVPIGLINLSIGGAPLETFIDKNALLNNKRFSAKVQNDWLENDALPVWIRERGRQNVGLKKNVPSDEFGKHHPFIPWRPPKASHLAWRPVPGGCAAHRRTCHASPR